MQHTKSRSRGPVGAPSAPMHAPSADVDATASAATVESGLGGPTISTVERIAQHIEERIIFGQLAPRERIQELKVAGQLGVSRGSVREALLVLEGRHMVAIYPRRGALVRALSADELAAVAEVTAQVTGLAFMELARRRPAPAVLAALQQSLVRVGAAVQAADVPALVRARQAYIEQPLQSLANEFVADLLRGLSGPARRLMVLASRNAAFDPSDTRRCAQVLLESTESQDLERIQQVLQAMFRRDATLARGVLANGH